MCLVNESCGGSNNTENFDKVKLCRGDFIETLVSYSVAKLQIVRISMTPLSRYIHEVTHNSQQECVCGTDG